MGKLQQAVEDLKPKNKSLASRYNNSLTNELKGKIRDSKSVANIKSSNSVTTNGKDKENKRQLSSKKLETNKSEKTVGNDKKSFNKKPLKEEITLPSDEKKAKSDDAMGKTMPNRNNKFNPASKKDKDAKEGKDSKEGKDASDNISKTPKSSNKKDFNQTVKEKKGFGANNSNTGKKEGKDKEAKSTNHNNDNID